MLREKLIARIQQQAEGSIEDITQTQVYRFLDRFLLSYHLEIVGLVPSATTVSNEAITTDSNGEVDLPNIDLDFPYFVYENSDDCLPMSTAYYDNRSGTLRFPSYKSTTLYISYTKQPNQYQYSATTVDVPELDSVRVLEMAITNIMGQYYEAIREFQPSASSGNAIQQTNDRKTR